MQATVWRVLKLIQGLTALVTVMTLAAAVLYAS